MEPVKGGTLASIPDEASALLKGEAPAHRAIRYAASQEGVAIVLSGMSTATQISENTAVMSNFVPLTKEEQDALREAVQIIRNCVAIPCTGCAYCVYDCPAGIPIPKYFALYNEKERDGWQANTEERYGELRKRYPGANACIECKGCEGRCPQKIQVSAYLKTVSAVFDVK